MGAVVLRKKTLIRALMGAQRQALLKTNKAYRTVSWEAYCVLVGVISIDLLIRERSLIYEDVALRHDRAISRITRRREILETWQARWTNSKTDRETYQYFPNINDRLKVIKLEWGHYATQFLSGHGNFNAKLHGFNLKEDQWVLSCGDSVADTAWHTLAECSAYDAERESIRSLMTGTPELDKVALVNEESFRKFVVTANKISRKKEAEVTKANRFAALEKETAGQLRFNQKNNSDEKKEENN